MEHKDPPRPSLIGMTRDDLRAALAGLGVADKQLRMRVTQIWSWLYAHGCQEFDQMSNVAQGLRDKLAADYTLARLDMAERQISDDGTRNIYFGWRTGNWSRRFTFRK